MKHEYTINDQLDHLTVLYHRGCKQGFKFFGDDPEEHKYYIKDEHIEIARGTFGTDIGTRNFLVIILNVDSMHIVDALYLLKACG